MKRDEDNLSPAERSLLRRFTEVVRVTDLMGLLMVVATACSAYATWRTAQITRSVFAVSERPYVGVAGVRFEHAETAKPRVVVDIRNFGQVQAEDAVIAERLLVDGTELPVRDGVERRMVAGVLSPGVPHPVFLHIPQEVCRSVQGGRSRLVVEVKISYSGPAQNFHCYFKHFNYDSEDATFYSAEGSLSCQ